MLDKQSVEVPGCRRAATREGVTLAASALALGCSRSVIVSDLSATGARFEAKDLPERGEELLMIAGSQEAFARVVWRTEKECGVRFDDRLDEEPMGLMKKEAAWTSIACYQH